ncbi:linear amide C-N hydrolase [Martelella lutilitoris]|uniref:linear amide C-N hydrolase n=1 Tax=Martelella lutilitoris TaxID=2583532 RepID=UPI001FEB5845|nr:linear amide C-N hydrolase [Martelella lutilitoris]
MACVVFSTSVAEAFAGITLTAGDGDVVRARTMEFNVDVDASVILVPRGTERTGETQGREKCLGWKARYASIGANPWGCPIWLTA